MKFMTLKEKYERNFLLSDFITSFVIIAISICIILIYSDNFDFEYWLIQRCSDFYSILATISGTLLGFVITGVAILLAFPSSERLNQLRKSKHYKEIYKAYFSAIKFLAITLIFAFIGLLCNESYTILIFYFVLWLMIISFLRVWRCYWILKNIIDIIEK